MSRLPQVQIWLKSVIRNAFSAKATARFKDHLVCIRNCLFVFCVFFYFYLCFFIDDVCIQQVTGLDRNAYFLSGSLGYISLCLNPFIYASRYEVFRRYLKQMMNKNAVTPSNTAANVNRNTAQLASVQQ